MGRGPICRASNDPKKDIPVCTAFPKQTIGSDESSEGLFLVDLLTKAWTTPLGTFGLKDLPGASGIGAVTTLISLLDPKGSVEDRVTAGISIVGGMVEKYSTRHLSTLTLKAGHTASFKLASRLLMVAKGINFGLTAWEILSMVGRGYQAAHETARSRGKESGFLYGLTFAVVVETPVSLGALRSSMPSRDAIPGKMEVSYWHGENKGRVEGYLFFKSLSKSQQKWFREGVFEIMRAKGTYNYFIQRKQQYGASEAINTALEPVIKIYTPLLKMALRQKMIEDRQRKAREALRRRLNTPSMITTRARGTNYRRGQPAGTHISSPGTSPKYR